MNNINKMSSSIKRLKTLHFFMPQFYPHFLKKTKLLDPRQILNLETNVQMSLFTLEGSS